MQVVGCKHWRIYSPPDAKRNIQKDPFNRGKVGDTLDSRELELLMDVILDVGDVLYIPKGFPHEADTFHGTAASLHLTIGIDSQYYGLTYAHLRSLVLTRTGRDLGYIDVGLDGHWDAMKTLPLGFLSRRKGGDMDYQEEIVEEIICSELKRVMQLLEPKRWQEETEPLPTDEEINEVIRYIRTQHLPSVMSNQREMLEKVANDSGDVFLQKRIWRKNQLKIMEKFYSYGNDEIMTNYFRV